MMFLRGLVLLLLFLPDSARRSIRMDDYHDGAQQQNNTLANGLEGSAESQERLIPGGFGMRLYPRAGPRAGALSEGSKQHGRRAERVEPHRAEPLFRLGSHRAKAALQADSIPEGGQLPPRWTARRWTARRAPLEDGFGPPKLWEQSQPSDLPEELMGPWELQCTVSGMSHMWVEFGEEGQCSCSAKVGKGRRWSATRGEGDVWRVRFVLLDKLSRPLHWEGFVEREETRGTIITGDVRGPPKARSDTMTAVVIGKFRGYKLL